MNNNLLRIFADEILPVKTNGQIAPEETVEPSMIITILILLAVCLVSTIIIETLLARAFKVKGKNLLIVVLAQIVTNPIVVLVSNLVMVASPWLNRTENFCTSMIIMEAFAIFVEGLMYKSFFKDYKFIHPLLLSLLLNLLSVFIGCAICFIIYSFNI